MATDNISATLDAIAKQGSSYLDQKAGAREQLLKSARQLIAALETPGEAIRRIAEAEPARFVALRTAVDLQLFEKLADAGPEGASAAELAKTSGADAELVARLLRHLAAMNVVRHAAGDDKYVPADFGQALAQEPRYRDGIIVMHDTFNPVFQHLPTYFRNTGFADPHGTDGPWQAAHKSSLPIYLWMQAHPPYGPTFNNYMKAYRPTSRTWLAPGCYPVEERLSGLGSDAAATRTSSDVLLVDVGGGLGHDCEALRTTYPSLTGRLVVQDLPKVVAQIPEGKRAIFEPMGHDFFTPQPVVGARAYYLHSILHNWDDDRCVSILQQLVPAMRRGWSRVLVNDFVVPVWDAPWIQTGMDMLMMTIAARERTEAQWRALARRAGLEVVGVTTFDENYESIVEMELAPEGGPGNA